MTPGAQHSPRTEASRHLLVSSNAKDRLAAARSWMCELPRDSEILVLASHRYAADELVRAVVSVGGSRLGIQRFTPNQFAARLAAPYLARQGLTIATGLCLVAVITRVIHEVLESGRAGRFSTVARRPGFPHAVHETFDDLRLSGTRIRELTALGQEDPSLAVLLGAIEGELEQLKLADRASILSLATSALKEGNGLGKSLLLLDLPFECELGRLFIAAIVGMSTRVCATAADGDKAAVDALEQMLAVKPRHLPAQNATRSLVQLQAHLFEASLPPIQHGLDDSVSLMSWPGEAQECIEIARRIHAKAAQGIPFDRIAVLLRATGTYRPHLIEALRRGGIPAWFAQGVTAPDPAGRALLALLACAAEGLSARRFAEYLSLAQVPSLEHDLPKQWVPPDHDLLPARAGTEAANDDVLTSKCPMGTATVLEGTLRAPWRWERLIVDASVIAGEDRWQRRLEGLAEELSIRRAELADDEAGAAALDRLTIDLTHLRDFALPLVRRLAALPIQSTWNDWLSKLRELASVAIRQPQGVLSALAELEPLGPVGQIDLSAVRMVLAPRLRDLKLLPEERPYGAVFVAPVEMARGLDFDVVFVPGLAEKLFPQRILQDALLPDNLRAALDIEALPTQDSKVAAERLKLRMAAGAAAEHLALSWPRVDLENARPRMPSFYGLEAVRAAEGYLPGFDDLRSQSESRSPQVSWPAPGQPEQSIDDTEYDLAVLAELRKADPKASAGAAAYLLSANSHLARALRSRGRRWLNWWNGADGLVDPDPETLAIIAQHRLGLRSFSVTALENFATCPYKFLLHAIHGLRPRDEIAALEVMDPLTRGALIHEIQFELLCVLRDENLLPLQAACMPVMFEHLDRVLARVGQSYCDRLAPAIPRVWEDGLKLIRFDLREWLHRATGDGVWVPHRFELLFGLSTPPRSAADPGSVATPAKVLERGLLRGSIDLVERRADGTLRVTDHKTGEARVTEDAIVWGGKSLQPVLYALAAEALLGAPVQSGRLYYCTSRGAFTAREVALNDASRTHAKIALDTIERAIEHGFLPPAPLPDACLKCDYRQVCGPHEELRTSRKRGDRLVELNRLRELP